MKFLLFATSLTLLASSAFAGNGGVGGGVGYQCGKNVYLADTYKLLYEAHDQKFLNKVHALNRLSPEQIVDGLIANLNVYLYKTGEAEKFEQINQALKNLNFVGKDKVALTGDHHIAISEIPCGGHIIQLARQYPSGLVELATVVKTMTPLEQALLKFHEIRIRVLFEQKRFEHDTTPVRGWVDSLTELSLVKVLRFAVINGGMGSIPGSAYGTVNKDGTYTWAITNIDCRGSTRFCFISLAANGAGSYEMTHVSREQLAPIMAKAGVAQAEHLVGYRFKSEIRVGIYALDAHRIEVVSGKPYISPTEDEVVELAASQVAQMKCPDLGLVDRETILSTFYGHRIDDFRARVINLSQGKVVVSELKGDSPTSQSKFTMIVTGPGHTFVLNAMNGLRCVGSAN